jgi:serine/threonine protein kinase
VLLSGFLLLVSFSFSLCTLHTLHSLHADFGLSRITSADASNAGTLGGSAVTSMSLGCLPYQAPEVFRGDKYQAAADVFSFGMVCYELISGKEPHAKIDPMRFANQVAYQDHRPAMPGKFAGTYWEEMINSCWVCAPRERPTFAELLNRIQDAQQGKSRLSLHPPRVIQTSERGLPQDMNGYIG